MTRAIFLDRDNTIIHNDGDLGNPAEVRLIRGAAHAIASLRHLGFRIIIVTNQGGVARGIYTEDDVDAVHQHIAQLVHDTTGGIIDRFYYCPFHPNGTVNEYRKEHPWRKPQPGMLLQAAKDLEVDLEHSWMVGDQERDIEAGNAAHCQTILITELNQKVTSGAHYCVETLAEAAAIIAQNRSRVPLKPAQTQVKPITVASPTKPKDAIATAKPIIEIVEETDHAAPEDSDIPETLENVAEIESTTQTDDAERSLDEQEDVITSETSDAVSVSDKRVDDVDPSEEIDDPADEISEEVTEDIDAHDELLKPEDIGVTQTSTEDVTTEDNVTKPENITPASIEENSQDHKKQDDNNSFPKTLPDPIRAAVDVSPLGERGHTLQSNERLLVEILSELRSWRQGLREFTPFRMFAFLALLIICIIVILLPIYLSAAVALPWVGTCIVAQLTILGLILLSNRG